MKSLFACLFLCATALARVGSQSAPAPTLRDIVERFDAAQATLSTLQAPFTLTIRRALLKTPTVTRGTLYLQERDFVHFAFAPPEDLILHLTPKALISYSPGTNDGEMLKIGRIRHASRRFLGIGQKLSELSDYFDIQLDGAKNDAGFHHLTLLPRALSVRKRMRSLQIWVEPARALPCQVIWTERGGDVWQLELGTPTLNQPLPAAVLNFQVPKSVPLRAEFSFFATRKK